MADADRAPDPRRAENAREFIAALQALKDWSRLTYRELAARADAVGDVLPRSTIANMLGRATLPREELVAAFVRACGVGPAELTVWLAVRKELATRAAEPGAGPLTEAAADATSGEPREPLGQGEPASPTGPSSSRTPEAGARRSRTRLLTAALALTVAVAATAAVLVWRAHDDDGGGEGDEPGRKGGPAAVSSDGPTPAPVPGKYRIRAVHSSLCLSERPQDKTAWVYQAPCEDVFPSFSLQRLDDGLWRIATLHPEHGPGCSGIMGQSKAEGAWLGDDYCESRGAGEEFRLEAVDRPAEGFRLRPVHTGQCLGLPDGTTRRWAHVVQLPCRSGVPGQVFRFDPVGSGAKKGPSGTKEEPSGPKKEPSGAKG
ncbi:XRE family transcriptional regulator [Streptomyces yatensis]|uniref:XRE family transcriptional regulator n=1 Tax=Streptomyces yatensis TaxID=155177 RepID=A0ABN2IG96_9ACTN|nr:XRE family transcriptional regulator [Streptomyces yatensis]